MQVSTLDLANSLIKLAEGRFLHADAIVVSSEGVSVQYRMRKFEEAVQSKNLNIMLRVLKGNKQAVVSSNSRDSVASLLDRAELMVDGALEDLNACVPDISTLARGGFKDCMYNPGELSLDQMKTKAQFMDDIALSYPGIENSEGSSFAYTLWDTSFARTGFEGAHYRKSLYKCALCVISKSKKDESQDSWYDYTMSNRVGGMEDIEVLATNVASEAVKRLDSVKVESARVPVVFSSREAGGLLAEFSRAFMGDSICAKSSFLCECLGKKMFNDELKIIDDPTNYLFHQAAPFDGEGVCSERVDLVWNGVISNWFLDSYTSNKLKLRNNAKCIRSSGGGLNPGYMNLYIDNGRKSVDEIIAGINNGLYVTSTMGMGINYMTGDYSKGVSGFWIENGKISYPVSETTVAGNLKDMFSECVAASDLKFLYGTNSPTLYLGEMMISGK